MVSAETYFFEWRNKSPLSSLCFKCVSPGKKKKNKSFGDFNYVLNAALGIVMNPKGVHSLVAVLKNFLIKLEREDRYSKNLRLTEGKLCWQRTKRRSGHIPKCMAQAMGILSIFWFDAPLKVPWPISTCGQWFINSQLSALIYNNQENSKKIFCLNKPDHFYMGRPSHAGEEALSLVMLVTEW